MKTSTNNSFNSRVILGTALISGALFVTAAFQLPASEQVSAGALQTVNVTAQRMSQAEKNAYDLQYSDMQTVVVSAKRLTAEQKLAMALEDNGVQQAAAEKTASAPNNG
jgi:hypothetical protein